MLPPLDQQVSNFFSGIDHRSALVFTTFGLDEAAVVELLIEHKVPSEQRVVVYHEIMKHKNPGRLQFHYPNSKVISVEMVKKSRKGVCPIFHSKLWIEISKSPFQCIRLAVLSGNLTRYHLDGGTETKTCESFVLWRGIQVNLPKDRLFDRRTIFGSRVPSRVRIRPATLIIELVNENRRPTIKIQKREKTVYEIISRLMRDKAEELVACASPFVNKTPIERLGNKPRQVKILSGRKRDGSRLHAKIIELTRYVLLGSPNVTRQAYGLTDQGIVNHETLVILRKPRNFSLTRDLKGFERFELRDLDDEDEDREPSEDTDGVIDWDQQKEWSIRGPRSVRLELNKQTDRGEIIVKGNMDDITKLTIHKLIGGRDSDPLLECAPRKHLALKKEEQQQRLVEAVFSPPVLIKGLKDKNIIWVRELNLGEFWGWVESNVSFMRAFKTKFVNGSGVERKNLGGNAVVFDDVRELRLRAYKEKKLTPGIQRWHKWICNYGKDRAIGGGIPNWCIKLREDMGGLKGA